MAATLASKLHRTEWPRLAEVFAGEGRVWLFIAKGLVAIYLVTWLSMWLQLESPFDSMLTVMIVMRPQSGTLLAKSFYRALGTVIGSIAAVALMSLVPQQRVLFLLGLALWLGICCGGATLFSGGNPIYMNCKAYGCMLAGYTAAIVVVPVIGQPLNSLGVDTPASAGRR